MSAQTSGALSQSISNTIHTPNDSADEMYSSYGKTVIMTEPVSNNYPQDDFGGTMLLDEGVPQVQISGRLVRQKDGMTYIINQGRVVVGSGTSADIQITDNGYIGRAHVIISLMNDEYYMVDNNSKNGTYYQGNRLNPSAEVQLVSGSEVKLANEVFTFYKDIH